jgi:uncharacterized protein YndB with AHSA1/START domain
VSEEPFRVEVTIAAPVDEVWRAMREPQRIRHWHGWEFDGLDEEIDLIFGQHAKVSEADHTLVVQDHDTFTLHDAGDGRTLLRLVRAPKGTSPEWDAYYDDISEGWITFMHQLRFALERHPGQERRTVFLDGKFTTSPVDELGITGEPGAPYNTGKLSGTVWFRSDNQVGVTVDEWGDGLLIIGTSPTKVMAVLTTYGLKDFDAFQAEWTAWWRERYPALASASQPAG